MIVKYNWSFYLCIYLGSQEFELQSSLGRLFEIEITFLCPLIGVLAGVFLREFPANPVKLESRGVTGVIVSVVK